MGKSEYDYVYEQVDFWLEDTGLDKNTLTRRQKREIYKKTNELLIKEITHDFKSPRFFVCPKCGHRAVEFNERRYDLFLCWRCKCRGTVTLFYGWHNGKKESKDMDAMRFGWNEQKRIFKGLVE